MEFAKNSTCSMEDWYQKKWYECANQTDAFIFELPVAGAATPLELDFTPTFTYHGFRFCEISATEVLVDGSERPLVAGSVAAQQFPYGAQMVAHTAHSDLPALGGVGMVQEPGAHEQELASATSTVPNVDTAVATPAGVVGAIFNMTMASHVSQLWSIPTDCPQREKRGWVSDL
jgi:hypothetical protein